MCEARDSLRYLHKVSLGEHVSNEYLRDGPGCQHRELCGDACCESGVCDPGSKKFLGRRQDEHTNMRLQ